MSKRLASVCRVIQRPHRLAGYITYMQRPGTTYTEVMPGNRRECLRAALEVAANRAEYDARRKSS